MDASLPAASCATFARSMPCRVVFCSRQARGGWHDCIRAVCSPSPGMGAASITTCCVCRPDRPLAGSTGALQALLIDITENASQLREKSSRVEDLTDRTGEAPAVIGLRSRG